MDSANHPTRLVPGAPELANGCRKLGPCRSRRSKRAGISGFIGPFSTDICNTQDPMFTGLRRTLQNSPCETRGIGEGTAHSQLFGTISGPLLLYFLQALFAVAA